MTMEPTSKPLYSPAHLALVTEILPLFNSFISLSAKLTFRPDHRVMFLQKDTSLSPPPPSRLWECDAILSVSKHFVRGWMVWGGDNEECCSGLVNRNAPSYSRPCFFLLKPVKEREFLHLFGSAAVLSMLSFAPY